MLPQTPARTRARPRIVMVILLLMNQIWFKAVGIDCHLCFQSWVMVCFWVPMDKTVDRGTG